MDTHTYICSRYSEGGKIKEEKNSNTFENHSYWVSINCTQREYSKALFGGGGGGGGGGVP